MLLVNLEDGRPTRNEALLRLAHELHKARQCHAGTVKIIHGYGSSGVGGILRNVVWTVLRQFNERGLLRGFCSGEDWRISNEIAWEMLKKHPELKKDSDLGRGNRGITIVAL